MPHMPWIFSNQLTGVCVVYHVQVYTRQRASVMATRNFPPASVRGQGDQSADMDAGARHPAAVLD